MEHIIETLYTYLDRPQAKNDLELMKTKEEYLQMSNLIKARYGSDFLDRMATLRQRIDGADREAEFSLGFRACARLLLEALKSD